ARAEDGQHQAAAVPRAAPARGAVAGGRAMIAECAREPEILEAVAFGRWPGQCPDLAAHAATCAICADLVEVARALHDDRDALCREAHPPAAGMVWWRATI